MIQKSIFKLLIIVSIILYSFLMSSAFASLASDYIDYYNNHDSYTMHTIKPTKREYNVGEELDLTGGQTKIVGEDGEVFIIPYTSDEIEIVPYSDFDTESRPLNMNEVGTYFVSAVFKDSSIPPAYRTLRKLLYLRQR